MKHRIAGFGEILWDILPDGPRLGGAPYNFTYRIDSLGNRGAIISRIGSDDLGDEILSRLVREGLETNYLQRDPEKPTGTVQVDLTRADAPDYVIHKDTAYDYIQFQKRYVDLVNRADAFYFGTLVQRSGVTRNTLYSLLGRCKNIPVFCDINLRKECYTAETVTKSLSFADIVKINDEETSRVSEITGVTFDDPEVFSRNLCEKYGITQILISLGNRGGYLFSLKKGSLYIPGFKVDVADTCGAGDAFAAGFLHRFLNTGNEEEALRFGNALGALVAGQKGATEPLSLEQTESFLRSRRGETEHPGFKKFL
ncbi:MAG: carbohydrate kinase family protein [Spirochaetia bacterium]